MPKPRILIAGAGIGGLTAALALIRAGFEVAVFEQSKTLSEVGAGLQISANGANALFSLGLEDALAAVWCEPAGKEVRLWSSGRTWKLFDLGVQSRARYGAPYFMVHRGDLHGVLLGALTALRPGCVIQDARAEGFAQDAEGVTLRLSDGRSERGEALVGADGVHSRIRNRIVGDSRASFTGCLAWRGLVPAERLPRRLHRNVGTNWVGPGGHVVHYFLRRGEIFNFVGIVERSDWQVESWTERGSVAECHRDFANWHDDIHLMIDNLETPYKWALLGREPLTRWSEGRVTLLGDAAHPTLPMMAQGANMAIEDGVVLARCLAAQPDDMAAALARYEQARLARTSRLVRAANDNAKRFHNPALAHPEGAQHYVDTEWQEERVKARYDWVFAYDPATVAV